MYMYMYIYVYAYVYVYVCGGHGTKSKGSYHGQHEDSLWWGGHKPYVIFVHHRSRRLGQLNSSSQVHKGLLKGRISWKAL